MEIAVCVKRVPMVGGKIVVTADGQDVDTRMSGFTVSPHEECAVEEAVQITERPGGSVIGADARPARGRRPAARHAGARRVAGRAAGDRRRRMGSGRDRGGDRRAGPAPRRGSGRPYDLLLFGNEAADTGDYQVGVRVAHALGLPCVTGIKNIEINDGRASARREYRGTEEVFDLPLPAVISVKEGINLPRYPSLPGRLRAKRAAIERYPVQWRDDGLRRTRPAGSGGRDRGPTSWGPGRRGARAGPAAR